MIHLVSNLKNIRNQRALSRSYVENELGLRSFILKDYETGRLKLPTSEAIKLANYYGVSLNELLGVDLPESAQKKGLGSLCSSFVPPSLGFITQDTTILSYLKLHSEKLLEQSIFDLLLIDHDRNLVLSFLFASLTELMESDKRVTDAELDFINDLRRHLIFENTLKLRFVSIQLSEELKHFFIWLLYLLAESDGKIVFQEVEYIDDFAQRIELSRIEYIHIKNNFIREME